MQSIRQKKRVQIGKASSKLPLTHSFPKCQALRNYCSGGKLPNVATLQSEYKRLQVEKEKLYADYGKLKKQVKEYDVIKRNIDSIL